MRVEYRGLSIEVKDDDARARQIAALLFSPEPQPAPEPPPDPVPPAFRCFWRALPRKNRDELTLLLEGGRTSEALEEHFGEGALIGLHVMLARLVEEHALRKPIERRGRGRLYRLLEPEREWVQALAEEAQAVAAFRKSRAWAMAPRSSSVD